MSIGLLSSRATFSAVLALLASSALSLLADQIQMQNGDRYIGRLLTLTNDTLVVQSDVLGTLRLPRAKVANILLAPVTGSNRIHSTTQTGQVQGLKAPASKTDSQLSSVVGQLESDTNSMRQIQQQFLSDAGPEATKKFLDLAEGLMSGKISLSDLRVQAASAAEQLRALKLEGGAEVGGSLDGYLSVLESFLNETTGQTTS